jgi:hypothetical protein
MKVHLLAAALLVLVVAGCSKPALGPAVEGVVTFDGQPLANANVQLIPQGDTMGQTGFAKTDAAGKFTIRSADGKQAGAPPGDYKVVISKHVKPDGTDHVPKPDEDPMLASFKELLPAAYSDPEKTKLKANVPTEGGNGLSFKLSKDGK